MKLYVPFYTLLLGGEVEIPLPKGTTTLKIPELTQSNTVFKLKGKGIKRLNYSGFGDQYVKIILEVPKNLSKEQKEILKNFDEKSSDKNYNKRKNFFDKLKDLF